MATEKKRKKYGQVCAAYGCCNRSCDEVSFHRFPSKTSAAYDQWVSFVQVKRDDWEPTPCSTLCSAHFTSECYPKQYKLEEELKIARTKKKQLLSGAYPTIHSNHEPKFTWKIPVRRSVVKKDDLLQHWIM